MVLENSYASVRKIARELDSYRETVYLILEDNLNLRIILTQLVGSCQKQYPDNHIFQYA